MSVNTATNVSDKDSTGTTNMTSKVELEEEGNKMENSMPMEVRYVIVGEEEGDNVVELPLDKDGSLPLSTLKIEFNNATGVKYKNPATGIFRIVAPDDNRLQAPAGGWGTHKYIVCYPKRNQQKGNVKRPFAATDVDDSSYTSPPAAKIPTPSHLLSSYLAPITYSKGKGANSTPLHSKPEFSGGSESKPSTGNFGYCKVCDVSLNSDSQASMHYQGKKHLERVAGGGAASTAPRGRGRGASYVGRGRGTESSGYRGRGGYKSGGGITGMVRSSGSAAPRGSGILGRGRAPPEGYRSFSQTAKQIFDYSDDSSKYDRMGSGIRPTMF